MEKIDAVGNVTGRTFWGKQIAASLPGIKQGLTVGLLGATLLFIAGCLATYLFAVNGRRAADFLIDVESEMHRVSWPTRPEWMGSSVVVIVSVVVIGGFVTLVDFLFRFVFTKTGIL
ncbi:MAG: preprotein translocase subunit SecE [Candidatus Brocadiae bacterium]|nr:preprotein translocase subunit SecE [Candidatus Brocadiia bacterium]